MSGESDNFTITTDDQWKLELPSLLDGTGSEMNSMYSKCICIVYQVVQKSYTLVPEAIYGGSEEPSEGEENRLW